MEKITLKCEIITPMFMGSGERIEDNVKISIPVELRPPSFKGIIRYWWRAAKGEDSKKSLKESESSIFGGAGEGEGRSKMQLSIKNIIYNINDNIRPTIEPYAGIKYLLYSTFTLRERGVPIERKFIDTGSKFDLEMIFFGNSDKNKEIIASVWLAIFLGGFGARSRRGGGNISVNAVYRDSEEIKDGKIYNLSFLTNTQNINIKDWFENNLREIKKIIKPSSGSSNYNNLVNGHVYLLNKNFQDWKDTLNYVGEKFKNFRTSNKSRIFDTPSFGMPISHSRFTIRLIPYYNKRRLSERFASPLIIKILKYGNVYYPMITRLSGINLETGKEFRTNRWNYASSSDIKPINYKIIDEFFNTLKNEITEIKY